MNICDIRKMEHRHLSMVMTIAITILCYSTSFSSQNKEYVNGDFSFTIPQGWEIKKELITSDNWQYVSCSKRGISSSGIVMIKWIKDSLNLQEIINLHVQKSKSGTQRIGGSFTSNNIEEVQFNSQQAIKVNYELSILSVDHAGEIYCFHQNGYTIFYQEQGANEDRDKNRSGFEKIKASFKCDKKENNIGRLNLALTLKGKSNDSLIRLSESSVELYSNNVSLEIIEADTNGVLRISLDFNRTYTLIFSCTEFANKKIEVNCLGLSLEEQTWDYELGSTVYLEMNQNSAMLNNVPQKILFDQNTKNFDIKN